jgi:hypothetical protein
VYEQRPQRCVEFECLWLQSQKRENPRERLGPSLRPDKCKVVFSNSTNGNPACVFATTMPGAPLAQQPVVLDLIERLTRSGGGMPYLGIVGRARSHRRFTDPVWNTHSPQVMVAMRDSEVDRSVLAAYKVTGWQCKM